MAEPQRALISLIRDQLKGAHELLEATMAGVTDEDARWVPPGAALPIGATYAHIVLSEDGAVQGLMGGKTPFFAEAWAGRTGVSELPPQPDPNRPGFPDWAEWSHRVRVVLPAFRTYAQAVFSATDAYLTTLDDPDLQRRVDLSAIGLGEATLAFVINNGLIGNALTHCGEISCLKGLRGKRGYPL
jgi:hypothetical protein